jgi:hypothetical protein
VTRATERSPQGGTSTTTGANGQTLTRESTRDGQGNGSTTWTGPNGQTATRDVTRQP